MPRICFKFTSELDNCLFVACQWLPSAPQNKSKCLSLAHSKFRMMFPKLVYPSSLQECYAQTTSDTSLTLQNPYLSSCFCEKSLLFSSQKKFHSLFKCSMSGLPTFVKCPAPSHHRLSHQLMKLFPLELPSISLLSNPMNTF